MKRKTIALFISLTLITSMLGMLTAHAADDLEVIVKENGKITVKVNGEISPNDWVGIYKEGEVPNVAESLIWWYLDDTIMTVNWPDDRNKVDNAVEETIDSAGNRPDELNEDFTLMPGKYYAIVLGGEDAYTTVFEAVEFEIKAADPADSTEEPTDPTEPTKPDAPESGDPFTAAALAAAVLVGICVLTVIRRRTNV